MSAPPVRRFRDSAFAIRQSLWQDLVNELQYIQHGASGGLLTIFELFRIYFVNMSGAVDISTRSLRPRRDCAKPADTPQAMAHAVDHPLLASLPERHRVMKSGKVKFNSFKLPEKQEFYQAACDQVLQCKERTLKVPEAADRVAILYNIVIAPCDKNAIRSSVHNRLQAAKSFADLTQEFPVPAVPVAAPATDADPASAPTRFSNRHGKCGRKRKGDNDALPSNRLSKPYKGATNHLEYQRIMKAAATAAALRVRSEDVEQKLSMRQASIVMKKSAADRGIDVSEEGCRKQILAALANDCTGISPQKPGGQLIPSSVEKKIAYTVKELRRRKFPVFPEEIIKWAAEEIAGTEYAKNFPDGMPTTGWYRGWLRRMEFTTGVLRPLEQTRAEWYTAENLAKYFEVARDVLIGAGVAKLNEDFDQNMPYDEEIFITHPERICSYDETKMELDCTRGGAGKKDRHVRAGIQDDGESIVTKSSKCASAACGRLGDGRALPPYIVFASGETYDARWAPHYTAPDIVDKDGNELAWRYTSNLKGSVDSDFCADYIENVLHPAMGYPPPKDTHPGQQGVIVCDGVGTHLCYQVIERAIKCGLEILLRVPNLSFVLQGEDVINFKDTKAEWRVEKTKMFTSLNKDRKTAYGAHRALGWEHFIICFKPAFDKSFTIERNLKGWRYEGLIPFNRHAFWRKVGAASPDEMDPSWRAPTANSLVSCATRAGAPASGTGPDGAEGTPEGPEATPASTTAPAPRLGPVPEHVQDAMDYLKKVKVLQCSGEELSAEQLVAQNLRLVEASKNLVQWMDTAAPDPKPDKMRITACTMYGLKGSATGDEGRKMAKDRHEANMAEKSAKADRKEQKAEKKAAEVAALVTRGAAVLKELSQNGPGRVSSLTVSDILALLTNADPQGNITKPKNKAEGLQRVRALRSVQTALSRHAASAAPPPPPAPAPAAPPAPGTAQEVYLEGNRPSFGSVGSSGGNQQPRASAAPIGPVAQ